MTCGSADELLALVAYECTFAFCCSSEFVGVNDNVGASAPPRSHWSMGVVSPVAPKPVTAATVRVPARLSQKMLLNSSGSLKTGELAGSVACSRSLLSEVDNPAGAGEPLLVIAVAVVWFFMIGLLNTRTLGASFKLMPPPSWVATLFTMMLL